MASKTSRNRKLPSPRGKDLSNGSYAKYRKDSQNGIGDNASLQEIGKLLSFLLDKDNLFSLSNN